MVNSGSFDSDVDRNEKDGFTQLNHIVETPQSVVSIHAVSGSLCENDFTTQTADSLPVSQAIEPTATKTEFKCNMSEEFARVRDKFAEVETTRDGVKETLVDDNGDIQKKNGHVMNMGYLKRYKVERKPSVCCSVPLDRIPDVLKVCNSLIAAKALAAECEKTKVTKKEMCLYCDSTFLIPAMKQKHMNRFHSPKLNKFRNLRRSSRTCLFCEVTTAIRDLKQLFSHLVSDHSEKYFGCLECEIRFPTFQALDSHKSSLHSNVSPLRIATQPANTSEETLKTGTHDDTTKTPTVQAEPPLTKTKTENKRNLKANDQNSINSINSDQLTVKTRRKCHSKYLGDNKNGNSTTRLTDSIQEDPKTKSVIKSKAKLAKELRNKKLSVISSKMGMKHCLRITRQRSKILENAKNSKKRLTQSPQKPQSNLTTKYITYPNGCSPFDISYRVKKITDHSIDNLRISSLTFDDVFDKAFFNRVKCNIQENLLNFVDGKLFKSVESENRISSFQKKEDSPLEESSSHCGYAITSTPVVLIEANILDDIEFDAGSKPKKKLSASTDDCLPFKYFTRRKYQAVISERKGNKDLSKLDMWTQLVMKNRQQKILSEQKTEKEIIEYRKSDEYKSKLQLEELNGILDKRPPLEDLKEEVMRTVALEKLHSVPVENDRGRYMDVNIILNDLLNDLFPKDTSHTNDTINAQEIIPENKLQAEEMLTMFNLQRVSNTPAVNVDDSETAIAELTGEWARTRLYVCGACGLKLPNAKLLLDHKNFFHVNVWCQHYEFVGNQGELYRHLSIPGLGKIGAIEDKVVNDIWRRSDARMCSKCNKRCNSLGELHRHILECGGDLAWMLERKKYKYRPYGSKTRKKRRGLLRILQALRNHTREKRKKTIKKFTGPRPKPSDADTIERMLANLPAKRTTRKVISLKDGFPRTVLTKKLVTANVQPLKKGAKNVIKTSVKNAKKKSNIKRTRRLLRSNSSILLENNLLLPKFKRKKNDNLNMIQRCSLRSNKSIPKRFFSSNPVVSTCKLPDDLIKTLTQNRSPPQKIDRDNSSENQIEEDDHSGNLIKDSSLLKNKLHSEIETVSASDPQPIGRSIIKKKKKRKVKSKVAKKTSDNKGKQMFNTTNMSNIRKLRFRNGKNVQATSTQKFTPKIKKKKRRNFLKKAVPEIIQVDGCSQGKSVTKSNVKMKESDSLSNEFHKSVSSISLLEVLSLDNNESTASQPSNSNKAVICIEGKFETESNKAKNCEPLEEKLLLVPNIVPPVESKIFEAVPVPQPSKRIVRKVRGLNDCIAMLTNKLHDKNIDSNGSNALESFYSKTIVSKTIEVAPVSVLNVQIENVPSDAIVLKSNSAEMQEEYIESASLPEPLMSLNNVIETNVHDVTVEKSNQTDMQRSILTESMTFDELDLCISDKPKVKHKRKKTRKKDPKMVADQSTINDKLQENNDHIFNGGKHNSEFNRGCSLENHLSMEEEKFSNSEKENTFSDHLYKVPKVKKTKRKIERLLQTPLPINVESPISVEDSHIIDVINAVAKNELNDSEDELPLAQLVKKYVADEDELVPPSVSSEPYEVLNIGLGEFVNPPIIDKDVTTYESECCKQPNDQDTFVGDLVNNKSNFVTVLTESNVPVYEISTELSTADVDNLGTIENINELEMLVVQDDKPLDSVPLSSLNNDPDQSKESRSKPKPKRKCKKITRKGKAKAVKQNDGAVNFVNVYCDICNKTFQRSENLLKHKRTLTHIAKLSELEALESARNAKHKADDADIGDECDMVNKESVDMRNVEPVEVDEYCQSDVSGSFDLGSSQERLKLVDIINDVLSKPVDSEYVQRRNFSNLLLQSDPEIKRCKSLGERKSFDCDKLQIVDITPLPSIVGNFEEAKISNTTADIIVEKQISLLQNMIEDNRNTLKSSECVSSEVTITDDYSCESNSSSFSILSNDKPDDLNEITFTHNTNIIAKLIKPTLDDHVIPSTQYEQISDDSNSSHFPIAEQKSRKVLNRDEELFLECCSLLKSSSDVSDLCRKSTKFFNNFGLKPVDELEWMEQKQIPMVSTLLDQTTSNPLNRTRSNTPVCDTFYSDVTFSNTDNSNSKMFLEKSDTNFFTQPPIFEDISTESEDSSRKSLSNSKSVAVASVEYSSNINLRNEDRSSPNVESAQIPCEDNDLDPCGNEQIIGDQQNDEELSSHDDPDDISIQIQDAMKAPSPLPLKKNAGVKIIQSNITDYITKKVKKHENKKLLTKGALKVFEGLKVSIPKGELDMEEVLSCSPTSKRLEIEAEQDKIAEKKSHTKKDFINKSFIFNKLIKNGRKINNKLGLKVTKKRYNVEDKSHLNSKIIKLNYDVKSHDIYDFEETQDSVDMFIKNSDSLPDYHSFKNKISNKLDDVDEHFKLLTDETKKLKQDVVNNSIVPSSRKLKMNKTIPKKKCMIMGRIFKNALKSKGPDEIKNIPLIENSTIVENFVMDCQSLQDTSHEKHKLSEEEMNLLFDNLLKEDNCNNANREVIKNDHVAEVETNKIKNVEMKPRQKVNRQKKRQKAPSSDASDEEFSLKKSSKKQVNRKASNDCVINLEQELKECIGVASRKSQRKCTSGKQNILVEYWSSDDSNFDYENGDIFSNINSDSNIFVNDQTNPITKIITSAICNDTETDDGNHLDDLRIQEDADDKSKEMKKRCFKTKHFRKKNVAPIENKNISEGEHNTAKHDSVTIASTRQKRNASDTLYYWSSSSEDEMQDIIEVKPLREDADDDDRPAQQGWIVGDSPKKLVTMLAQAKGKKLDVEYVKKNRKKKNYSIINTLCS